MVAFMGRRAGMAAVTAALIAFAAFGSVSAGSSPKSFVKSTIKAHDVVIFSKTYCPEICGPLLACVEDGGEIQDALLDIVGKRTVPQVFINGKHLGGSDDTVEAYESGNLAKLLYIDDVKDDL